jgi:predicted nuclease of restriction endonuclease-like (RecB) superfamily
MGILMPKHPHDRQHVLNTDTTATESYQHVLKDVAQLLTTARQMAARAVNTVMTSTYWEIGHRIVEYEQGGQTRAEYGEKLIERLSTDLTQQFGRGFSVVNLRSMRRFYLEWPPSAIQQTPSVEFEHEASKLTSKTEDVQRFPLPWSHYVLLMTLTTPEGRAFYEAEAIRGGWTVRQLDRQINAMFYERTALSRNKAALLSQGERATALDHVSPSEEIKDPYVLEFLDLKDEYSESDLEQALIEKLSTFLLELGDDFAFLGRQRRLRIGDEWYRVDLLFFHRRLRSLVVIDLKLGKFTHADAGQMHLYLNYAREHWMREGENPPVGLILCARKDHAVARYALEGLPNTVLAAEYRMTLPDEHLLAGELEKTRRELEQRRS